MKDPTFINPELKGIYVWESGWEGKPDPQDGFTKLGVQLTSLDTILSNLSYQNFDFWAKVGLWTFPPQKKTLLCFTPS